MRTELHFHLLPAVDDGPRDDVEAVELARLAVADGTGRVVLTPHAASIDFASLSPRVGKLRTRLAQTGVKLEIQGGAELAPDDVAGLSDSELGAAAHGPPGRRWLLLEAPLFPTRPGLAVAAAELRERGYGVLIGHPERSASTPMPVIEEQVELGCLLQINASSLVGGHGADVQRAGLAIARSGLPFVVASDAHSPARPPQLSAAAETLGADGFADTAVREAIDVAPERLLFEGLPPAAADPLRRAAEG
jgi:protein-tyrosine phosphatase